MDGTAAAVEREEAEQRPLRVLVVDNDRTMRELVAYAFQMRKMEAWAVGDFEEADARVDEADGLLLDYHLGAGFSGASVARHWAEQGRLPPFWLVTGMPEEAEVQALSELVQFQGVVGKPFSVMGLVETVAERIKGPPRNLAPLNGVDPAPISDLEPSMAVIPESEGVLFAIWLQELEVLDPQRDPAEEHHSAGPDSVGGVVS